MINQNLPINITQKFNKLIFNSKKINIKDTIVIAGSPRSGTTWLLEILLSIPGYSYIFEPLNPIWFPESFEVGFRSRTYLPSHSLWPEGQEYLNKIFTGSLTHIPTKESQIVGSLAEIKPKIIMHQLLGNKLIVKSINFNRLLPWIAKKYPLKHIFLIIRHPCASVASQIRTGLAGYRPNIPPYADIFPTIKDILDEAVKIPEVDKSILNRLKKIETQEEILAAVWCLDNIVPLSSPKPYPWSIVFYEKLVKQGKKELPQIFKKIGEEHVSKSAYKALKTPSMATTEEKPINVTKPDKQLAKWKTILSVTQIERILRVVSNFGLDFYSENLEPEYTRIDLK